MNKKKLLLLTQSYKEEMRQLQQKSKASKYIRFVPRDTVKGRKTLIIDVVSNSSNNVLGVVKWYSAWRQYCFFPMSDTVWNVDCMQYVQEFIEINNVFHKETNRVLNKKSGGE